MVETTSLLKSFLEQIVKMELLDGVVDHLSRILELDISYLTQVSATQRCLDYQGTFS
jgi:hypothetical protein